MSRTVLVTGGTGFLGRHLVHHLLGIGAKVRVLARGEDEALTGAGAEVRAGSILDPQAVASAAKGCEAVVHCAGLVSRDPEHAARLYQLHVEGTRTVLTAAAEAGVGRLVLASTSGTVAVSRDPEPVPDETFPDPIELIGAWPYYTSKLYQERAAFRLGAELGVEVVSANPSLLLGPGDSRVSSVGDVLNFLQRDVPVVPPGGLSFVDARDVAVAMTTLLDRGEPGQRYLLTGANLSFEHFFDRLAHISGVDPPRMRLPKEALRLGAKALDLAGKALRFTPKVDPVSAAMAEVFWYADDAKARRELDFVSRDPYETLADTVLDLKERGLWEPRAA